MRSAWRDPYRVLALPVLDFLLAGDAFFVGCQQLLAEGVELLVHQQLRLAGLVMLLVPLDLPAKPFL